MESQEPQKKRTSRRKKVDQEEVKVEVVDAPPLTEEQANKYAKKKKVATPTLGRSPNYVEKVGLGKLKVITADGTDYQP